MSRSAPRHLIQVDATTSPWLKGERRRFTLADVFVVAGVMLLLLAFGDYWRATEGSLDLTLILAVEQIRVATNNLPEEASRMVSRELTSIENVAFSLGSKAHWALVKFLVVVNLGVGMLGAGLFETVRERLALRNQL